MIHPRTAIRDYTTQLLKTGVVGVGEHVFKSRFRRLPQTKLPALLIYTRRDQANDRNISDAPRVYKRHISLNVEVVGAATKGLDDTLDDIAREVELLLENDNTLGGLVHDLEYRDTQIELDGEQDPPLGVAVMEFMVSYEDDLMEPVTNDLSAVHADWNLLTEPDEQNEAQDKITFTP